VDRSSIALPPQAPAGRPFRVRPGVVVAGGIGLLFAVVAALSVWQATHVKPTSLYDPATGQVVPANPTGPGN
jgi:hypothetical protein